MSYYDNYVEMGKYLKHVKQRNQDSKLYAYCAYCPKYILSQTVARHFSELKGEAEVF